MQAGGERERNPSPHTQTLCVPNVAEMVYCLECYAGKDSAPYGVKLEDQVLVTKEGALALSTYPFESKLL
tara:strand:+ start:746 stop:955 length:210 start_codon:yes stop_codon:yes gene_type:complete